MAVAGASRPEAAVWRRTVQRYGVALVLLVIAALLTFLGPLPPPREKSTLVFLFAAVLASSAYGGLGPGLLATAVTGFIAAYVILDAPAPPSWWDGVRLAAFVGIGVLSSVRSHRLKRTARQREELLARERDARAEAEAANQAKDRFLAVLAHELRNPLAPIRNALYLLRADPADAARVERGVAIIERQTRQLVRLVEDLLDVARLGAGKLALHRVPIEVSTVLALAVETARPAIDARAHQLTVRPPSEPVRCRADEVRLSQVIANLLENAAKYTQPGGAIVLAAGREGDEAVIRVRDTGVGIEPAFAARMFDVFVQGEPSGAAGGGGLGIGLSLVRHLVELHEGRVEAHSGGPGQGTEFVVRLPALPRDVPGVAPSAPPVGRAARPLRVLVVEDNPDAADTMAGMLGFWGHEVRVAREGEAALAAAGTFRPEVVLLDVGLPGMSGYEVARRLRAQPETHAALVIGLSGYGQPADERRARAAGFDRYLVKPADPAAIESLLSEVADGGRRVGSAC